jgi:HdeA/HdeB family
MKSTVALLLLACLAPIVGRAAELNLATLSCDKYENEILPAAAQNAGGGAKNVDSINTVMWLFGYSVAKAGEHVMYGDALTSFGFALDAECKNSPSTSLLEALSSVRPKRDKPMDLTSLTCAAFESRHAETTRTDPDSAATLMMWLFGFSVGQSGSHLFDAGAVTQFASTLQTHCGRHPEDSLFDALAAVNKSHPKH